MGTGAKLDGKHTETDYGLKLLSIEIGIPETLSEREQLSGRNIYVNTGNKGVFKQRPITLTFDRMGDYEDWLECISLISADVAGQEVKLELDSQPGYYYYGVAAVSTTKENNVVTSFAISITADPLKYADTVSTTLEDASSSTLNVSGDYETPCIIELTPSGAITTYTIQGAARDPVTGEAEDIVIKNLSAGKTVIIDGEACTVTEDGANKYADTEMWEFPTLLPGENALTFTSSSVPCDVTIKYKPRYI